VTPGQAIRGINVHPSLLPFGRGSLPYPHVILEGHSESGVTVHEMDAHFDTGPILFQDRFTLSPAETARSLRARSRRMAAAALVTTLADFEALWQARRPQQAGAFWKSVPAEARIVDWNMPPGEIERRVRALEILGITARIAGETRSLLSALALPGYEGTHPGEVLVRDNAGGFLVAAAGGAVWVTTRPVGRPRGTVAKRLANAAARFRRA
jgi:methionyl-tRNA formyltransferase